MTCAYLAFTDTGLALAKRLAAALPGSVARCGQDGTSLAEWTGVQFVQSDALIFVGAAGIAVRAIAPHCKSKTTDPAVVVVDECGRFAVPILSGHLGGANDLARTIAAVCGAVPVITTATDAHGIFAVDEWAKHQNCTVLEPERIKLVSGALLAGKTVALIFSKASTRTRTSFEVGVYQMGGLGNYMNTAELQAGRGEPLRDTARVLGRYYDCAVWRTYRQRDLEELAELSGIPVINGLTDYAHPCQVLADLMTIRERRGTLAGLKLCFVGDGSNMANSLIVGGLLAGMQVSCVCPPGYRPAADVLMFAHEYGNAFHLTTDPAEGLRDADIVATAAWNTTAPGTAESEQRLRDFVGFQLTGRLLENAKPGALVLHCLPAHRGEEISTALFEQHADEIFDEAENRLHVQKAVLAVLLAGK